MKPTDHFTQQLLSICHPDLRPIPADVRNIAQHCLLDWVSVTINAATHPVVQIMIDEAANNSNVPNTATLLGSGHKRSIRDAACINGMASHLLDFDDTHLPSRVHPSAPLWSAIFALGESLQRPAHQLITAFIAGVELQSRLAAVLGEAHYAAGWHNTATLGTFGATFASGILLQLSELQMRHAIGIAASLAGGLRAQFGTDAKPLQVGMAASHGVYAARLAHAGIQANTSIFDENIGYSELISRQIHRHIDQDRWYSRDIVFKYHASCYGTQAPIHAALHYQNQIPEQDIQIFVEPQYLTVCNIQAPQTLEQVKFSIRHMVALALLGKDTVNSHSLQQSIKDEAVLRVRDKIQVFADPTLPRANARIAIKHHADIYADLSRPQQNLYLQQEYLREKSLQLLEHRFDLHHIMQIHTWIEHFDKQQNILPLIKIITAT